jgi:AcrR family transcriptional regulator
MRDEQEPPPQGRGARTRQKVLEAALAVVKEHPLADVQLVHIAERAGISPGHVLYHFQSKEQILVETLRWSEGSIAVRRADELRGLDDPTLKLQRWTVLFLPHGAEDPTWKLWLEFWLRSASHEHRELPAAISHAWLEDLEQIVDEGIHRGAFRPVDRDQFMSRTHALLIGLSIGVLVGWHRLNEATRLALKSIEDELGCVFQEDRTDTEGASSLPP